MGSKQKQQNKKKSQEKPRTLKSLLTKGAVLAAVVVCIMVGNSHLLTGFNPYEFTKRSGLNCFLLGASGVGVADLYFT